MNEVEARYRSPCKRFALISRRGQRRLVANLNNAPDHGHGKSNCDHRHSTVFRD